jgi:tRNA/rRNA methyltransferase
MNPGSPLDRIRIVLVETSHAGNMGAAARAMKTMGLNRLYLVRPKAAPDAQAAAMACGAADVLQSAVTCASLDDALSGTVLAYAVTARRRDLSHRELNAREAALHAGAGGGSGDLAFVFGGEMSGLSNEDVLKCQRIAHIPANEEYSSLNLAAAVQVICYEVRMALQSGESTPEARFPLATFQEVERFYQHLEKTLTTIHFLNPQSPKRLMTRMRRIFARIQLEREEVQILRGVLKMILRVARRDQAATGREKIAVE